MKKLIILLLTFTICGCNSVLFDKPFVVKTIKKTCTDGITMDCRCNYYSWAEEFTSVEAPCGAYQIGDTIKLQL